MPLSAAVAASIAQRFVEARRRALPLSEYPGAMPADLQQGYAIQEAAIELWGDELAGWKIGMVAPELRGRLGADRIAGPIFRRQIVAAGPDDVVELPVVRGGFAAVEAEFVLEIGHHQDPAQRAWTAEEAAQMVKSVHIGVELAGSPFPGINDHGAAVTVSDFGNNAGLIIGAEVKDWRALEWGQASARTHIDASLVGEGNAGLLPGGPLAALTFLLEHCAARGRPLRPGHLVSSGAVTGVHRIEAGQSAELSFGAYGVLRCRAASARGEATPVVVGVAV